MATNRTYLVEGVGYIGSIGQSADQKFRHSATTLGKRREGVSKRAKFKICLESSKVPSTSKADVFMEMELAEVNAILNRSEFSGVCLCFFIERGFVTRIKLSDFGLERRLCVGLH